MNTFFLLYYYLFYNYKNFYLHKCMPKDNESFFSERKSFSAGEKRKIKKTFYKEAPEEKVVNKTTAKTQTAAGLSRKDILLAIISFRIGLIKAYGIIRSNLNSMDSSGCLERPSNHLLS